VASFSDLKYIEKANKLKYPESKGFKLRSIFNRRFSLSEPEYTHQTLSMTEFRPEMY
jgi:hypothetical protein